MGQFDRIIDEITDYQTTKVPVIAAKIRKLQKSMKILDPLIQKVDLEDSNYEQLKNWRIVAIDGGSDFSSLEGVAFAVSSARSFIVSTDPTEGMKEYSEFEIFDVPASDVSQIVTTTQMKALEAKVAMTALENLVTEDTSEDFLFLFDGAFSFPDTSVGKTKIPELTKAYDMYSKTMNKFLKKAEKNAIQVLAISKDARSAKYLKALMHTNFFNELSLDERRNISDFVDNEKFRERVAFQTRFRKLPSTPIMALDPVNLNVKGVSHGKVPMTILQEKNYYGSYYFMPGSNFAHYVEMAPWTIIRFQELFRLVYEICRVSPVYGYPYPLVYADRLTKMSKEFSTKIFQQIMIDFKTNFPYEAQDLLRSKMREALN